MSWASRRRALYGVGALLVFFAVVVGPIAYTALSETPTCSDGKRNQGETSIDKGGPCAVLDSGAIAPLSTLWARAFRVRDGAYNAVAYVQNPNTTAGVRIARYKFGLYDERNVVIAEREGTTFIMPGATTPIFEGAINTGNRIVAHTFFEFTGPLTWERLDNTAAQIAIGNRTVTTASTPSISAVVTNGAVRDMRDLEFVVAVSDASGNAFAASQTVVPILRAGQSETITFTWPDPFPSAIGSIDITALSAPAEPRTR